MIVLSLVPARWRPSSPALCGVALVVLGTAATAGAFEIVPLAGPRPWIGIPLLLLGCALVVGAAVRSGVRAARGRPAPWRGAVACLGLAAVTLLLPRLTGPASSTVTVEGRERTYHVDAPRASATSGGPRPLVLVFHGFGQTWRAARALTGFDDLAEREGVFVVYPEGTWWSWNDGDDTKPATRAGVDEEPFVRAILDRVEAERPIDPDRVYAVGFSNGGFLLVRLACRLSDRVTAIGVVGAGVYPEWDPACEGDRPVPAIFVRGGEDPMLAPLEERFDRSPARSGPLWAEASGCATTGEVARIPAGDGAAATVTRYRDCPSGGEVSDVVVHGAGHTWPGGPQYLPAALVGPTSPAPDATRLIWDFLRRQRLE